MTDFTTTREELWQRLFLDVPHRRIPRHDGGADIYKPMPELLEAFYRFCNEKERAENDKAPAGAEASSKL